MLKCKKIKLNTQIQTEKYKKANDNGKEKSAGKYII